MGNPFTEDSKYIFAIDTKNVTSDEVVHMVWTILDQGQEQFITFIEECFEKRTKLLSDPIKSNKLPLLSKKVCRLQTSVKNLSMLKNELVS